MVKRSNDQTLRDFVVWPLFGRSLPIANIRLRNITGFVASGEPQCSIDDHLVRSWRRSCNQLVFAGPRLPFVQRPAHGRRHKAINGSARRRASRLLHRRGVWSLEMYLTRDTETASF